MQTPIISMMDYLLPVEIELLPVSERITMERQMARKGCERERSRDANPEWPMYFFPWAILGSTRSYIFETGAIEWEYFVKNIYSKGTLKS